MGRKKYIAEFLGTFTLVFVGAGCVCANSYLVKAGSPGFGLLGIAIAFGVVVVAIVYSLGYISGAHINPAVTISMVMTNRMGVDCGLKYILSQLAGASFAGFLLRVLFPEALYSTFLGTCVLGSGVTIMQAILMEAVITFLLVFVVYTTVIDKRANPTLAGFAIGFVYEYLFAEKREVLLFKKPLEIISSLVRGSHKIKELVGKRISSLHIKPLH